MFFPGNKRNFCFPALLALVLAVGAWNCVKTDFDEPPVGGEGLSLTPNSTIKHLKSLHPLTEGFDKITEDIIIEGQVIMDDRSGNYYKTIVIQDSTGGIEVKFNDGYLYQQFPVGRTIYIRCKDLYLTDYRGLTQLIGGTLEQAGVLSDVGITDAQVRSNIVKGSFDNPRIVARVVKPEQVTADMISTLVQLKDVEFVVADTGKIYADAVTKVSVNRTLESCANVPIVLRTSGYANFASQQTPTGKGTVTGVLGIFGTTYQLFIRDPSDVSLTGPRCGAGTGTEELVSISSVRSIFTGTTTHVPVEQKIRGVVISDRTTNNVNNQNVYLQDATAGILVRFDAAHSFNLGDEIEVIISEQELYEYKKLLELNGISLAAATRISTGKTVTPRTATIAEINANHDAWESTLVKINNVTLSGGTVLGGGTPNTRTAADGTGSIALFTQTAATFANNPLPTGPVMLTAIVSEFNTPQLILRSPGDIQP